MNDRLTNDILKNATRGLSPEEAAKKIKRATELASKSDPNMGLGAIYELDGELVSNVRVMSREGCWIEARPVNGKRKK